MDEYCERLRKTAIRFSEDEDVVLSPQLEDYSDFPHLKRQIAGKNSVFRLVFFVDYIDMNDIAISFPDDSIIMVHVKHDFKATDEQSHRMLFEKISSRSSIDSSSTPIHRTKRANICSRDCRSYFRLPLGVVKEQLTAQWTQDAFLIIRARDDMPTVKTFESKRLVPMKVCGILNPSINLNDVATKAQSILESALRLWTHVKALAPRNSFGDLYDTIRRDPSVEPRSDTQNDGDESLTGDGSDQSEHTEGSSKEVTGSAERSEAGEGSSEEVTGSAERSEAGEGSSEKVTGSAERSEAGEGSSGKVTGSAERSEAGEGSSGKVTGSAKRSQAAEKASEKKTVSTAEVKAIEKIGRRATPAKSFVKTDKETESTAKDEAAGKIGKRITRSSKSVEETEKIKTGSIAKEISKIAPTSKSKDGDEKNVGDSESCRTQKGSEKIVGSEPTGETGARARKTGGKKDDGKRRHSEF